MLIHFCMSSIAQRTLHSDLINHDAVPVPLDNEKSTMAAIREKVTTQVDADLLSEVRQLANQEGRQLQAIVEEALKDLMEKRLQSKPRPGVMAAYQSSHKTWRKTIRLSIAISGPLSRQPIRFYW